MSSTAVEESAKAASDRLNEQIGVLTRREVEARIIAPLIAAMADRFGQEEVTAILCETIVAVAEDQGRTMARQMGSATLSTFAESLRFWTQDGALEIEMLSQDEERLEFDVTRCRYAEMYRSLGIPELGAALSCNRDRALIQGFNAEVTLARTQTIMEGAHRCDFRYHLRPAATHDSTSAT